MKYIDLGNDDDLDPEKTEITPPSSDPPSLSPAEREARQASRDWEENLVRKMTTPPPLEMKTGGVEDVVSLLKDARVVSAIAAAATAAMESREPLTPIGREYPPETPDAQASRDESPVLADAPASRRESPVTGDLPSQPIGPRSVGDPPQSPVSSSKPADSTTLGDVVASITFLNGTVGQVLSAIHGINPNQYTSPIGPAAPPQNQYTSPIGPTRPPASGPPQPPGAGPQPPGAGGSPQPPGPVINAPPRHRQILNRRKRRSSWKNASPQTSTVMQHGGAAMAGFAKAGVAGAVAGFTFSLASGTRAVNRFEQELERAAQGFEKYAPRTQVARADQQISQINVEMRRAAALDTRMAEFVTLQTEISASFEDFKTRLFKILLDIFVPLFRSIWESLQATWAWVQEQGKVVVEILDQVATAIASIAVIGEVMSKAIASIANLIREILKKADENNAMHDPFIDDLLKMQVPLYPGPQPFRRPPRRRPAGGGGNPPGFGAGGFG